MMQVEFRLISTLVVVGAAYSGSSLKHGVHDPAGQCSGHCPAHPGRENLVLMQRHASYLPMNKTVDSIGVTNQGDPTPTGTSMLMSGLGKVNPYTLGVCSDLSYDPPTGAAVANCGECQTAASQVWGFPFNCADFAGSFPGSTPGCIYWNTKTPKIFWNTVSPSYPVNPNSDMVPVCRAAPPTPSPTASPTSSPTLSPTASPTASPTQAPTASPTSSPTLSPTASPTASPTQAPTPSPTSSPTASTPVSASGDPHLINLRGERFDVNKVGMMEFLRVPYESVTEKANLTVFAMIQDVGGSLDECKRALYITSARFGGAWLRDRDVEVSMHSGEMVVSLAGVRMKPSPQPVPIGSMLQLHFPRENQLHVHIGAASVDISHDIQRAHFFLNMRAASLGSLGYKIGGLLGEDTHDHVSKALSRCQVSLLATPHKASRAMASASLGPN